MQNIKLLSQVPFPASAAGNGGIKVTKSAGQWLIEPDFASLAAVASLPNPTSKQMWIFDPVSGDYNVLTLAAIGASLFTATSATSVVIGTGAKSFVTQPGKLFGVGFYVTLSSAANP